ncbi:ciliary neurotrophic factor-like [Polypterus senegalus]
MATGFSDSEQARRDHLSKATSLARKVHKDAKEMQEIYRQKQGLSEEFSYDEVDGIPSSGVSKWNELSDEERLRANASAFHSLHCFLGIVLKEQREDLTPEDGEFHEALLSLLAQVETLAESTKQLLLMFGHVPPSNGISSPEQDLTYFKKKLRGYKVLLELSTWALRATRDFTKLQKQSTRSTPTMAAPAMRSAARQKNQKKRGGYGR